MNESYHLKSLDYCHQGLVAGKVISQKEESGIRILVN